MARQEKRYTKNTKKARRPRSLENRTDFLGALRAGFVLFVSVALKQDHTRRRVQRQREAEVFADMRRKDRVRLRPSSRTIQWPVRLRPRTSRRRRISPLSARTPPFGASSASA
jgi:hypothetical protein